MIDDNRRTNYSYLNTNNSLVNQVLINNPLSFSNEFNLVRPVKANNIIEFYSHISHLSGPENRTIGTGYNAVVFNHGIPYAQLVQTVNVPTWFTNNYISYEIPGNNFTQSVKAGYSVQSQILTSSLDVLQANHTANLQSDSAVNQLAWNNKKLYAEADYDIPEGKLKGNLALPLTLQQLNYSDINYALNKGLTQLYFNPQLNLRYQTGVENFVTLQYSFHNETGTIEDIYRGDILKDYRTLYANNADLTQRENQQVAAGFNYRKTTKLFFFNINASYNHTRANNIASSIITNNLQQSIVLPYRNSTGSWTIGTSTSKYLFKLRTTFSVSAQWQSNSSVQIQNNVLLPFYTTQETANISADTKVNDKVNFSYRATLTQTGSHSAAAASAYHVGQLTQQASMNYNPSDDWQFKLSGEHYFTRQQGSPDLKYFFADASAKFRIKKWRTDLQLDATNLLNVKTYNSLYLSANTFIANSYALPGRIVLLKVLFNL